MAYYDEEDLLPGEEFYYATDPLEGQALRTHLVGQGMDVPPLPENWRAPAPLPSGYGVTYSTQGPADLSALREGEIGNGVMAQVPINAQNIVGAYAPGRPNVPIPGQSDTMFSPDFMQGIQEAYKQLPYQVADKAVSTAIQALAWNMFRRDITSGVPWGEAAVKYGRGMFWNQPNAYPNLVKQLMPPTMTPAQVAANEIARRRLELDRDRIAAINERAKQPKRHFGPNGEVIEVDDAGNVKVLKEGTARPSAMDYETVTTKIPGVEATPDIPAEKKYGLFGIDWLAKDLPAKPGTPGRPEETRTKRVPVKKTSATKEETETIFPDLTIATPTISEAPIKLPKTKNELVVGKLYITSKGNLRWNGEKFVR